jgi:hypothetical protein
MIIEKKHSDLLFAAAQDMNGAHALPRRLFR